ncbi:MAG: hypothetical protein JJ992_30110 [Planctomycetes bacterium]|nr:hypothetical protein [Planctomycetota bacterium]
MTLHRSRDRWRPAAARWLHRSGGQWLIRRGCCYILALLVSFGGCSGGADPNRPVEPPLPADQAESPPAPASATAMEALSEQHLVERILDGHAPATADPTFVEAVRRVDDLGGSYEFDAAGRLIGIDLASGRVTVSGADLQHLLAFGHLVRLKIASGDVTNADLATLARLTGLQELALRNTKIDGQGLRQLAALDQLKTLDLQRSLNIKDDAVGILVDEFPSLEELVLVEGVFSDTALAELQKLSRLQRLDLRSCSGLTAEGIRRLEPLRGLRVLKIGGAGIDDASLEALKPIRTLTSLTIEDASITDAGLEHLVRLPLQDLNLARCFGITDQSFAPIGRMEDLRQLYVRDILVSGSGLGQLASLGELATLRLRQTGVDDAALSELASLPALRRLELALCLISDEGLSTIGHLTKLVQLDVEENRLTDAGVKCLGQLSALERLSLAGNEEVTDASVDLLVRLTRLRDLDLRRTSISQDGSQSLRNQLPECRVLR